MSRSGIQNNFIKVSGNLVYDFSDFENWSVVDGNKEIESSNINTGTQSIKITSNSPQVLYLF